MHTISMLRRTLGLSSDNQVRNRIERIKDLLSEHIRRGPNNQIFLTEPGLEIMRQFQELCDTGLTLAEASQVLRFSRNKQATITHRVSPSLRLNVTKPDETRPEQSRTPSTSVLLDQMAQIRDQLAALSQNLSASTARKSTVADAQPWWIDLREDIDVT